MEKIYGPYTRADGRKIIIIVDRLGNKKTKSYPKYLKELELGRELLASETVDHKDRDFTNDVPENLQILSASDNAKKSALRRKSVHSDCVYCGKNFELTVSQLRNRSRKKSGPFCSRTCSGNYGSDIKNSKIGHLPENDIQVEYYRNDD